MPRRRPAVFATVVVTVLAAATATGCAAFGGRTKLPVAGATTTTTAPPSTSAPSTSTTTASSDGPFVPAPVEWSSCGGRLKCATLLVPRDYSDPGGPTIELSLNELPARDQSQRIGSLLV